MSEEFLKNKVTLKEIDQAITKELIINIIIPYAEIFLQDLIYLGEDTVPREPTSCDEDQVGKRFCEIGPIVELSSTIAYRLLHIDKWLLYLFKNLQNQTISSYYGSYDSFYKITKIFIHNKNKNEIIDTYPITFEYPAKLQEESDMMTQAMKFLEEYNWESLQTLCHKNHLPYDKNFYQKLLENGESSEYLTETTNNLIQLCYKLDHVTSQLIKHHPAYEKKIKKISEWLKRYKFIPNKALLQMFAKILIYLDDDDDVRSSELTKHLRDQLKAFGEVYWQTMRYVSINSMYDYLEKKLEKHLTKQEIQTKSLTQIINSIKQAERFSIQIEGRETMSSILSKSIEMKSKYYICGNNRYLCDIR